MLQRHHPTENFRLPLQNFEKRAQTRSHKRISFQKMQLNTNLLKYWHYVSRRCEELSMDQRREISSWWYIYGRRLHFFPQWRRLQPPTLCFGRGGQTRLCLYSPVVLPRIWFTGSRNWMRRRSFKTRNLQGWLVLLRSRIYRAWLQQWEPVHFRGQ